MIILGIVFALFLGAFAMAIAFGLFYLFALAITTLADKVYNARSSRRP